MTFDRITNIPVYHHLNGLLSMNKVIIILPDLRTTILYEKKTDM